MKIGDLPSELLLSLPEDVFALISRFLSPSDVFNLTLSCKTLCDLVDTEQIWFVQCEVVKVLPLSKIVQWRLGISSYKSLCRFLVEVVKPLVGVWVHQNPELGNVVYVMPGFLSVVGCRIIPQEVGSLGIQEVMWSPVFEIVSCFDGSARFFLHGVDGESSFLYPGFVTGIDKCCNVLLLEVEPRRREKSLVDEIESLFLGTGKVRFPFCKLPFCDRRKLLYLVTGRVGLPVTELSLKDDKAMSLERRTMLLKMHKFGGNWNHMNLEDELCYDPIKVEINDEMWTHLGYGGEFRHVDDENQMQGTQRKSLGHYFRSGIKNILRRSSSTGSSSSSKQTSISSEIRRSNLQTFLSSGDFVGLSVKASEIKLSSYRGWPNMHETHFALYKLPIKKPVENQEYAGLWGGTFGWPPGKCTEEKPGKALFLLMLTYEESQDDSERLLIGTKILEGTHYVMHPNGSAMFVVKIGSPSFETFPFDDTNGEEDGFECSYTGEGIAKGYGFRYPGYKPGSLFVTSKGLLMFVWKETKVVLTLQRLDLEELLKKGVCVSPLPPCLNFTYLTKSHTNVFASGQRTL